MKDKIVSIVEDVIAKPAFDQAIYTEIMKRDLEIELYSIYKTFDITLCKTTTEIIEKICDFLELKVKVREDYYCVVIDDISETIPKAEFFYRTAYAALVRGEATSVGIAEATMMILAMYDINSKVMLSTFENNGLFEYVIVAMYLENGEDVIKVIDIVRQKSCKYNLKDYKTTTENIVYAQLNPEFFEDKIGINGFGISLEEYKKCKDAKYVIGQKDLYKIL